MSPHAWFRISLCAVAMALTVCLSTAARATPIAMAVMGDSISAGSSGNWIGHLKTSFPTAITFFNSAKGGATTDTVISGQLKTVITQATKGQIDHSTLIIGGNNATNESSLLSILTGNPTPFINNYFNDVKQIIDSVAAAGPTVRQVFGNMPDVTVTPLVQSMALGYGVSPEDLPAVLQVLSDAIGQANALANAYALSQNVPVIDLYSASQTVLLGNSFPLGGHTYTTAFAADNFHPAGWVQGLLANMVTTAYNLNWGESLPQLSDQQIVANLGNTPNGLTTYFDVTPFILLPAPEPASWVLAASGIVLGLAQVWRGRRRSKPVR